MMAKIGRNWRELKRISNNVIITLYLALCLALYLQRQHASLTLVMASTEAYKWQRDLVVRHSLFFIENSKPHLENI